MFDKIDVNGGKAHPLYNYLKHQKRGFIVDAIKWNFTKVNDKWHKLIITIYFIVYCLVFSKSGGNPS